MSIDIKYPCRVEFDETDRLIYIRDVHDKILLFEKIGFHSGYRLELLDQMAIEDESWIKNKELYNLICRSLNAVEKVREYIKTSREVLFDTGLEKKELHTLKEIETILDGREGKDE